jgi:hypothetical protein
MFLQDWNPSLKDQSPQLWPFFFSPFHSISLWHGIVIFICPLPSTEEFQASYNFNGLRKNSLILPVTESSNFENPSSN